MLKNTTVNARNLFHASTFFVIVAITMLFMAIPVSATTATGSATTRTSLYAANVTISLESDTFTYTGEAICPKVSVRCSGSTMSTKNYTIKYYNNTEIGTGIVKVTGKKKLCDTMYLEFTIIDLGQAIADYASSSEFVGLNYVYGGTTKAGFDCSGFVQYIYKQFGIELPRTADSQMYCGTAIYSIDELQPGDIVAFYGGGHVGIYIGDGQFVHAANSDDGLIISSFYDDPDTYNHYAQNFTNGARVI